MFDRLFSASEQLGDKGGQVKAAQSGPDGQDGDLDGAVASELAKQFQEQDVYNPIQEKPPVSLFKSIFLDDSDSDSESESEGKEGDKVDTGETEIEKQEAIDIESESALVDKRPSGEKREYTVAQEKNVAGNAATDLGSNRTDFAVTGGQNDYLPPVTTTGKVTFVSKKNRLQYGSNVSSTTKSSILSFGPNGGRFNKQKKLHLVGREDDDAAITTVTDSPSDSATQAGEAPGKGQAAAEGGEGGEAMVEQGKRRKHLLSDKRKPATATLTFSLDAENNEDEIKIKKTSIIRATDPRDS